MLPVYTHKFFFCTSCLGRFTGCLWSVVFAKIDKYPQVYSGFDGRTSSRLLKADKYHLSIHWYTRGLLTSDQQNLSIVSLGISRA